MWGLVAPVAKENMQPSRTMFHCVTGLAKFADQLCSQLDAGRPSKALDECCRRGGNLRAVDKGIPLPVVTIGGPAAGGGSGGGEGGTTGPGVRS